MLFNSDPKKPSQEVLFLIKSQIQNHPTLSLNNIEVERSTYQKHLGVILDEKLNFKEDINSGTAKVNKGISVIKKLRHIRCHGNHYLQLTKFFKSPNSLR